MKLTNLTVLLASAVALAACRDDKGGLARDGAVTDTSIRAPDGNDASAAKSFSTKLSSTAANPRSGYLVYPAASATRAEPKGNDALLSIHVVGEQDVSVPEVLGPVLIFKLLPDQDCEATTRTCVPAGKAMSRVPTLPHPLLEKVADRGQREVHLDGGPEGSEFLIVRTGQEPSAPRPAAELPTLFVQVRDPTATVIVTSKFDKVGIAKSEIVKRCPTPGPFPPPKDGGVPPDAGTLPLLDDCDPSGPLMVPDQPGAQNLGLSATAENSGSASVFSVTSYR